MKKNFFTITLILIAFFSLPLFSTIRYVNPLKNGLYPLEYKTIQQAIDASVQGDTVQILPGVYDENINIGKKILVQGAGQQNTVIQASDGVAVTMSNGALRWVKIISLNNVAVRLISGTISNCIITKSPNGIYVEGQKCYVDNSVIIDNVYYGIVTNVNNSWVVITNCIFTKNNKRGSYSAVCANASRSNIYVYNTTSYNNNWDSYGIGSDGNFYSNSGYLNLTDAFEIDVGVTEENEYRPNSNAVDKGYPEWKDPDGSRSDLGYYGGPWAPIFPYMLSPVIQINEDGTLKFEVKGKIAY